MDEKRLTDWEPLFIQALTIIDSATAAIGEFPWSFGGGTALMLKYRHRYSRDIDIFLRDPQFVGYVSPRLSEAAAAIADGYDEAGEYVKIYRREGEIDFICTGWLTTVPFRPEPLLGRSVNVETPAEIIAKKVHHRAATFKARDFFDLATVLDRAPDQIASIAPVIRGRREDLESRIHKRRAALEEEFAALDLFDTSTSLEQCIDSLRHIY